MRPSGWLFMLVSWGVILGVFAYCMIRTLRPGPDSAEPPEQPEPSTPEPEREQT